MAQFPPFNNFRKPLSKKAMAVLVVVSLAVIAAVCLADLSSASPVVANSRDFAVGIAVVLMLASTYTVMRVRDEDNHGSGDRG